MSANSRCPRISGIVLALLLPAALIIAHPANGISQQLRLSADVGKTTFFEGEPVYLLVRLQNVGTDTAWTASSDLLSPAVTLSVSRGHGKTAPVPKPVSDHFVRPSWRGEPVPPGADFQETVVLQVIMGDAWDIRSHLFPHHLSPDQYELHLDFDAHWGVPRTTPLIIEAGPIVFRIRERTSAEENELRELEAMRQMGWDTTRVQGVPRAAGYKAALFDWVRRRVREQPQDPLLPFLLSHGLHRVGQIPWRPNPAGGGHGVGPAPSERVGDARLA